MFSTYILTNYVNKVTGIIYHGSELSFHDRFKSGLYQKIESFQCNQNQPFSRKNEKGNWNIFRTLYGKDILIDVVEKN